MGKHQVLFYLPNTYMHVSCYKGALQTPARFLSPSAMTLAFLILVCSPTHAY